VLSGVNTNASMELRIAALLDGRLTSQERQELLTELSASDEWRWVLADAARLAAPVPQVVRRSTPAWFRPALAIAASVVVVVGAGLWFRGQRDGAGGVLATLNRLQGPLPAGWSDRPWSSNRGASGPTTDHGRAVRVGVTLADLHLAIANRDTAATIALLTQSESLLADVAGSSLLLGSLRALAVDSRRVAAERTAAEDEVFREVAKLVGDAGASQGAWLEMARLAAIERDGRFFSGEGNGGVLEALVTSKDSSLQDEVRQLQTALAPPLPRDWTGIRTQIEHILATIAR